MRVRGLFEQRRPFIDLTPLLDLAPLDAIHEEVCLGLAQIPVDYTGGSHRSMGIVPPSRQAECHADYGEAIRAMTDDEFATLCSLSDGPEPLDPQRRHEIELGEERDHPLSRRQMLWLKYRFGVYFPWKVYVELVPNRWWGDKSRASGKSFTRQARAFFPATVAWIERLPFAEIGRCTIMGLEANDHGTVHHDGDPAKRASARSLHDVLPGRRQAPLSLGRGGRGRRCPSPDARYWFNDQDDHGVDADPFFRYSIRVDGIFRDDFLARLREEAARAA